MRNAETGEIAATCEITAVHLDRQAHKSMPFEEMIRRTAAKQLAWFVEPYLDTRSRSVVEAVQTAAEGLGLTPAQVALLWGP